MLKKLALVFLIAGLVCFGVAIYPEIKPDDDAPLAADAIAVECTPGGMLEVPEGTKLPMELLVHNRSKKKIRIVGCNDNCQISACVKTLGDLSISIEAGETGRVAFNLEVKHPGPFEIDYEIFIDYGYLTSRKTTIQGTIIPKDKSSAAISIHQ
jgi:hypothetical protein